MKSKILLNKKGGLTIDFIFAFTLVMGLAAILLSLSLTMTVASITQYITFSSARALFVSHHTSMDQAANAREQFDRLHTHPVFAPLYNGGWFELKNPATYVETGDIQSVGAGFPEVEIPPSSPQLFVGVTVNFIARMLDFQIPFYGSTSDFGGDGSGFITTVGSFLSKEPSVQQCMNFNTERWKAIRKLNIPSGSADYTTNTSDNGAVWWINDNGC